MKAIFLAFVLLFSAPAFATHPPPLPTVGEHGAMMLFINMDGESGHTQADIDTGMANLHEVSLLWHQKSNQTYQLNPIISHSIDIPFIPDCELGPLVGAVTEARNAAGIDFNDVGYVIYKITDNREFHNCNFTGFGFRWDFGYWEEGKTKAVFITKDWIHLLLHEMGHNLGFRHAVTDADNNGIVDSGFTDISSYMGGGTVYRCLNAVNLHAIGWRETKDITESGIYTIPHLYSSNAGTILRVERLLMDEGGDSYYLSFRKENYACDHDPSTARDRFYSGVSIHHSKLEESESLLIRPTAAYLGGEMVDGSVFSDGQVKITQLSHTADDVTVLIDFGDYEPLPDPPPPPIPDECEVQTGKPTLECWCKDHPGNKKCR